MFSSRITVKDSFRLIPGAVKFHAKAGMWRNLRDKMNCSVLAAALATSSRWSSSR